MARLIITQGLPGSGKTTTARKWVSADRDKRARVNRDDIRNMLHDGWFQPGVTETWVILVRNSVICSLLEAGIDVICDDTNLPRKAVSEFRDLATHANAQLSFHDFREIPLQMCLDRNASRTDKAPIPEEVIRGMHDRYIVKGT